MWGNECLGFSQRYAEDPSVLGCALGTGTKLAVEC